MVRQARVIYSINNTQLVSKVKDTDGLTVWSDGSWNKYDSANMEQVRQCLHGTSTTALTWNKYDSADMEQVWQC